MNDEHKEEPGIEAARKTAEKLKQEKEAEETKEEEAATQALDVTRQKMAAMYRNDVGLGTEDISADDINIPQLKLVQPNKPYPLADGTRATDGWWYRTDTKEQIESPEVTILVVRKAYADNFKKTAKERQHIYFGIHEGTNDLFRMYARGWSLNGSREFVTQVKTIQSKYRVPMFALKVQLSSMPRSGQTEDGAAYSVFSAVFTILKDEDGYPILEDRPKRVTILRELAKRFTEIPVQGESESEETTKLNKDVAQDVEPDPSVETEQVNPDDIPF